MSRDTDQHSAGDTYPALPPGIEHEAFEELYAELEEPKSESAIEGKFDRQRLLLRALRLLSTEDLAKNLDKLATATGSLLVVESPLVCRASPAPL